VLVSLVSVQKMGHFIEIRASEKFYQKDIMVNACFLETCQMTEKVAKYSKIIHVHRIASDLPLQVHACAP
jgi:hypothetical protein